MILSFLRRSDARSWRRSLLAVLALASPGLAGEAEREAADLLASGRCREALAALEKAAESPGDDPGLRVLLGRAYLGMGRYEEAEQALSEPASGVAEPARLEALARLAEDRGEVDRALDLMTQAVAARRTSLASVESLDDARALADSHTRLGEFAFRAGRLDLAREQFQKAITLVGNAHAKLHELGIPHDENDPRMFAGGATAGLARIYSAQGDDRRAERTWRSVAARADDPAILASLGADSLARDDARTARRHLDRALQLTEGKPGHRRIRALLLAEQEETRDEALVLARAAFEDGPDIRTRDTVAWVHHLRGEDDLASEVLRPALELGTQDPLILYHAGIIAQALGQEEEAKRLLSRAIEINPAFDPVAASEARHAFDRLR